jgi:tripartite-type tricarboxylate transporter receptor subunit TctC
MRSGRSFAIALLSLCACAGSAIAQDWPHRALKLIVPFASGDANDSLAQGLAASLQQALGQRVEIENRPDAGGTQAANAVATAAPDGYTLGIATTATHPAAPLLQRGVPYHAVTNFQPVTLVAAAPYVLLGSPQLKPTTLAELVAFAKDNPRRLTIAHLGPSTVGYVLALQLRALAAVEMEEETFDEPAQVYAELAADRVSLFFDESSGAAPLLAAQRIKAYAATAPVTSGPSIAVFGQAGSSVGLRSMDAVSWYGITVPVSTPPAVVARIQNEVAKYVASEQGQKALRSRGLRPIASTPEEFAAVMARDTERFTSLGRRLNIQAP